MKKELLFKYLVLFILVLFLSCFLVSCKSEVAEKKPWYGTYTTDAFNESVIEIDENSLTIKSDELTEKHQYTINGDSLSFDNYNMKFYENYTVLSFGNLFEFSESISVRDGFFNQTMYSFNKYGSVDTILTFEGDGSFKYIFVNAPSMSMTGSYVLKKGILQIKYKKITSVSKELKTMYWYVNENMANENKIDMFVYVKDAETFFDDSNQLKYELSFNDSYYVCVGIDEFNGNALVIPSIYKGKPVKLISNRAFYNCSGLTSITIGNSVTSIGEYAFSRCSSLTSITIPNSVESIGDSAFDGCSSLTRITIPDSVTSIGSYAFYNCENLNIYCEVTSRPPLWDENWIKNVGNVIWGYKS